MFLKFSSFYLRNMRQKQDTKKVSTTVSATPLKYTVFSL